MLGGGHQGHFYQREEEAGVQVAPDQGKPSVSGDEMGVAVENPFLAGIWEVAGDKSRGWAQWDQTQVLRCGWLLLPVSEARITFIHSFIHSPILKKYTKHRITQADHLFPVRWFSKCDLWTSSIISIIGSR